MSTVQVTKMTKETILTKSVCAQAMPATSRLWSASGCEVLFTEGGILITRTFKCDKMYVLEPKQYGSIYL